MFPTPTSSLKPISLSVAFWHLLRHLTGIQANSITWSHPAPTAWMWEAATPTDLPPQGPSEQARAREWALTGSWWQPAILCAGGSLMPKYKADLLWTMLPPWIWAIKYCASHTSVYETTWGAYSAWKWSNQKSYGNVKLLLQPLSKWTRVMCLRLCIHWFIT